MEKVSRIASLNLRCGLSQRSFDNKASSSTMNQPPVRKSDNSIDFEDVFGGPPVWTRYSYSGSRIKPWEESTISPTASVDMPVFGETCYSPRTNNDFFNDNFKRRHESVQSGSSILNHIEPFATLIPAEFRNNSGQSAGRTLLSHESSNANDQKSKGRTGSSSIEFHFSIYKWANLGVPLLMSASKGSIKVSALSFDNMKDSGFQNEDVFAEEHALLHDEIERKGYKDAGTEENMETASGKKKLDAKKISLSDKDESYNASGGSPKNRVKGMVKGFFKI